MAATIRDVAQAVQVSETTVSLSFRAGSRISAKTRERVLAAAARLGYMPNQAAQDLRLGKSTTLGFLVPDMTNPFYAQMMRYAQQVAQESGYSLLLAESQWQVEEEKSALMRMAQARVAGVLVCFCDPESDGWQLLQAQSIPHVALDVIPDKYAGAYAKNDLYAAGKLAAEHLVEIGCRCPVLCIPGGDTPRFGAFRDLHQGFAKTLRKAGIRLPATHVIQAELSIEGGMACYGKLRETIAKADGVFCGNDLCALGILEAADQAGEVAGRDFAVIGIDDLPASSLSRIGLTSIRQPLFDLAETASRMLIAIVDEDETDKNDGNATALFSPALIVRSSTSSFVASQ